ncbi:retrovirus-related pol polyprotein from transposon TNT 1-94 [Tanacetum coccineum]
MCCSIKGRLQTVMENISKQSHLTLHHTLQKPQIESLNLEFTTDTTTLVNTLGVSCNVYAYNVKLMKNLPQFAQGDFKLPTDSDDELDNDCVAGISWYYCLSTSTLVLQGWIIDTDASDHMTLVTTDMLKIQNFKLKPQITLPNGQTSLISQMGKVHLKNNILLKDDLATRKVLGLGKRKAGLYHLLNIPLDQIHNKLQSMVVTAMEDCSLFSIFSNYVNHKYAASVFSDSYNLWHHRLGHVSDSNLKHIPCVYVTKTNAKLVSCMSCPMAKFAKLPYTLSESHALEPFNLIHIDIWGPYKVATNGKYKYFLTIVDEFSRATWIYLLVQKSDACSVLVAFFKFVQTQFDKKVKIVRSDNALEFLKGSLGPYMTEQGIEHQTSCVDRPQQNGRVERKHRHVLEVARALRFHAHLPLTHWGDCVITATYLINKTPSSVLNNPDRTADKFSHRGVPCLFLGYPQHQKGYKLLNLLNKKKFVSRDVQFYEHVFHYSNPQMLHLLHPLPSPIPNGPHWYDEFTSTPITQPSPTLHTDVPIPNTAFLLHQSKMTLLYLLLYHQFKMTMILHLRLEDPLGLTILLLGYKILSHLSIHQWLIKYQLLIFLHSFKLFFQHYSLTQNAPNSFREAIVDPQWCQAMDDELRSLELNGTCEITDLPPSKKSISCHWIYKIKLKAYGSEDRKKARQGESVQNVPRSGQVCKLKKSLYGLKQAPRQWFAKLSTAVLVYVDDHLITGTHSNKMQELKNQLSSHFHMKDLSQLSYILGLEMSNPDQGIFISQKKYTLKLLKEAGVLNSKPYKLPMDQHVKLQADSGTPLPDPKVYGRLIGKLVYLTITRPGQGVLFANSSAVHLTAYCDSDWASCPMSRRSTTGYCILLGEYPLSWKSKKQNLGLKYLGPVDLKCDNQAAIHIAANLVFHARTKHIEVDCHYVRDQIMSGLIHPSYVPSKTQLVDVFTKVLPVDQHNTLLSKLGISSSLGSVEGLDWHILISQMCNM